MQGLLFFVKCYAYTFISGGLLLEFMYPTPDGWSPFTVWMGLVGALYLWADNLWEWLKHANDIRSGS